MIRTGRVGPGAGASAEVLKIYQRCCNRRYKLTLNKHIYIYICRERERDSFKLLAFKYIQALSDFQDSFKIAKTSDRYKDVLFTTEVYRYVCHYYYERAIRNCIRFVFQDSSKWGAVETVCSDLYAVIY